MYKKRVKLNFNLSFY